MDFNQTLNGSPSLLVPTTSSTQTRLYVTQRPSTTQERTILQSSQFTKESWNVRSASPRPTRRASTSSLQLDTYTNMDLPTPPSTQLQSFRSSFQNVLLVLHLPWLPSLTSSTLKEGRSLETNPLLLLRESLL